MVLVLWLITLGSWSANALEQDQKIIGRILGISDTKRTILVNKGAEQGLEVGDHAKFSTPRGMIARGVVVRKSPSRSIWSLYRVSDLEKILPKLSVAIKMSSPVKVTRDESKYLGPLAKYVRKKENLIPEISIENERSQARVARSIIRVDKKFSKTSNVDFSGLEDSGERKDLDPDVDWAGINGEKDFDHVDDSKDFSNLK